MVHNAYLLLDLVVFSYDGEIEGWEYSWTFPNALLFTVSIMTMVGYGHIAPQTLSGKVFTIFYSLIALGVFLVMVAIISGALSGANACKKGHGQ